MISKGQSNPIIKEIPYWPYCEDCHQPFDFEREEPFAYCECGPTEWGYPRPFGWIPQPERNKL